MEDRRHAAATVLEKGAVRSRSINDIRMKQKQKMKAVFHKVGYQIKKVRKGNNKEGYYSDDHNQNPTVVEYSLSRYGKNAAENDKQQLRLQKKGQKKQKQLRKQGRDDEEEELLCSSVVADEIRSSSCTANDDDGNNKIDADADGSIEVEESLFFNPLKWLAHALPFLQEESINECGNENKNENDDNDDRRESEAEGDEGYQADREPKQEQEQHSNHGGDEDNDRAHKRNHIMKRSSKITTRGKTAHETESPIAESEQIMPSKERAVSLPARSLIKSAKKASKSSSRSKAFVSGAKKVTNIPVKFVRTSSRLLVSNAIKASKSTSMIAVRSSKAITHGAQRSSRALAQSIQKTSKTSKELASSIKRMGNANQKKAASALLVSVHAMIQRSDQFRTPGLLLDSIQTLIHDSETTVAKSRKIAFRERHRRYRKSKSRAIEYGIEQQHDIKEPDENVVKQVHLEVIRADTMSSADLSLVRSVSDDGTEISATSDVYHSEYDNIREEDDYSEEYLGTDTDWDDRTRNSDTSAYYSTDFNNGTDSYSLDETDIEIEGMRLYSDFAAEDVVSERSETEGYSSDDGYTTGASAYIDNDETSNVEYKDTYSDPAIEEGNDDDDDDYDDDDDDMSWLLSERDKAILDGIEKHLERLEDMQENEREGLLYRTFFPED